MYSSVDDMVMRFGQAELIRLTTPEGQDLTTIDTDRVDQSLTDSSGLIDSYLRKRYAVPLVSVSPEITRAAAVLARYDLANRGTMDPSEQMRLARRETIAWLERLAQGSVTLDGLEPTGDYSGAMVQDRGKLVDSSRSGFSHGLFDREGWPR